MGHKARMVPRRESNDANEALRYKSFKKTNR